MTTTAPAPTSAATIGRTCSPIDKWSSSAPLSIWLGDLRCGAPTTSPHRIRTREAMRICLGGRTNASPLGRTRSCDSLLVVSTSLLDSRVERTAQYADVLDVHVVLDPAPLTCATWVKTPADANQCAKDA